MEIHFQTLIIHTFATIVYRFNLYSKFYLYAIMVSVWQFFFYKNKEKFKGLKFGSINKSHAAKKLQNINPISAIQQKKNPYRHHKMHFYIFYANRLTPRKKNFHVPCDTKTSTNLCSTRVYWIFFFDVFMYFTETTLNIMTVWRKNVHINANKIHNSRLIGFKIILVCQCVCVYCTN